MNASRWLGGVALGRLMLPDASPNAWQLYGPRGVWHDGERLVITDSGNHRVLIWHNWPTRDHQPADIVLGQPNFTTEGPRAAGRGSANGLCLPTGIAVVDGALVVCDAWHHRLLVWHRLPTCNDTPPDAVIGQRDFHHIEPNQADQNRVAEANATGLYWPYGVCWHRGWLWVADTGNRRVLGWPGLPLAGQPAAVVLGQDHERANAENRGGPVSPRSFRWPHAIAATDEWLLVADAGNHRVLGWRLPVLADRDAELVLGQADFTSNREWPHGKQGPQALRFPYGLATHQGQLAVADTANNRVLIWHTIAADGQVAGQAADLVLGQADFDANGENRWQAVRRDTLCWPYGICWHGDWLAVADSGNNRVMLWQVDKLLPTSKRQENEHVLSRTRTSAVD